jgi:ribosomal protein L28
MAYKCDSCLKGVQYGETSKHGRGVAGNRWKKRAQHTRKVFKPNLHYRKVTVGGVTVRMRLCTKCLRRVRVLDENRWVGAAV